MTERMFGDMNPRCPRCAHQVAKKGLLGWECASCFLKSVGDWNAEAAVKSVDERRETAYKASAGVTIHLWKAFHDAGWTDLLYSSPWPLTEHLDPRFGPRWVAGVLTGPNPTVCVKECATVAEVKRFESPGGWTPEDAVEQALIHLERLTGSRVGDEEAWRRDPKSSCSDKPCPQCGSHRHHDPGPDCEQ